MKWRGSNEIRQGDRTGGTHDSNDSKWSGKMWYGMGISGNIKGNGSII